MGSPTLSKSWNNTSNVAKLTTGTALTDHQQIMLQWLTALLAFGSCTVQSSSNSVTASTGNNCTANANFVWNNTGSAHTWFCVRFPGVGATFDVLFDLNSTTISQWTVYFAPGGYQTTGLSTTARPATNNANDEINVTDGTSQWIATSGTLGVFVNVWQSTDGQCTRVFCLEHTLGNVYTFFAIEKIQNASSQLSFPAMVCSMPSQDDLIYGSNMSNDTAASDASATNSPMWAARFSNSSVNGVGYMRPAFAMEYCASDWVSHQQTVANDLDQSFAISPIQLFAASILPVGYSHGNLGNVADMWMGQSTGVNSGDTYASKTFIQINQMVLPWNGTTPSGPTSSTDRVAGYLAGVGDTTGPLGGQPLRAPTPSPPVNRAV